MASEDPDACFQIQRHGKKQSYLTFQGGMSVALRRNISNVSAKGFGSSALEDISHQTVARWEVDCGATVQGGIQQFHKNMEGQADQVALEGDI
eukprot:9989219-Karenia_brevis.AAC.1